MQIPQGVSIDGIHQNKDYVILLKKSLYRLKQASNNWYSHLKAILERRGFRESLANPCIFIKNDIVILVYVNDCVLLGKDASIIQSFIDSLKSGNDNFDFTDEGSMDLYLGVDIQKLDNNEFILRQPFLIQRILQAMDIDPKETNERPVPVIGPLLTKDSDGLL